VVGHNGLGEGLSAQSGPQFVPDTDLEPEESE